VSEAELRNAIEAKAVETQRTLNLQDGPLMRMTLFETRDGEPDRFLIVIHHLVVDGVSWRILLEDLETAYDQLCRGETVQLPPKTTSLKTWSLRLNDYAQSEPVDTQLDYWLSDARTSVRPLPLDYPNGRFENRAGLASHVHVSLSQQETESLLREVPKAYKVQINDALLTALLDAFTAWTGEPRLLVDMEGHGREDLFEDVDLSRTVGWFTTMYPVLLARPTGADLTEVIESVKHQLSRLPQRGMGYGLLRYLRSDPKTAARLRALRRAEVSFNYLGQFDQTFAGSSLFQPSGEAREQVMSPSATRSHLIEVNGAVLARSLRVTWTYGSRGHHRATITKLSERFADALRSLIESCQSRSSDGYTPSDFPLISADQNRLDRLISKRTDRRSTENQTSEVSEHGYRRSQR